MPTLLLKLAGPLQAWGTGSKFETRSTGREPSKSGIVGMVAAAMGRPRSDPIDDLASLKFGVRIDQVGTLMRDFHTVHDPKDTKKTGYTTDRLYLQDACFLAGLEGDAELLRQIENAFKKPFYPIFLGRRSCPPTGQIVLGMRDEHLMDALRNEKWQASEWYRRSMPEKVDLEIVSDAEVGTSTSLVNDLPVSFDQRHRRFAPRHVLHDIGGKSVDNTDSTIKEKRSVDWFSAVSKGGGQ